MAPRRAVAPALALLLASCAATSREPEDDQNALLFEGDAQAAAGRPRAALKTFSRAIERYPDAAEPYYRRGSVRLRMVALGDVADETKELARAVDDFGAALQHYPLHFEASFNRGLALAALSRYREAAQDLGQAAQATDVPLRRDAHAKLAELLEEKFVDMEPQALRHYDSYIELGGRDSEVLARSTSLRDKVRAGSANPEDEVAAKALLEEARVLLAEGRKDLAAALLASVARHYAKTRIATQEALPLLKGLEEKK
jgi:tetratricopeptide (TPR) repeat protein